MKRIQIYLTMLVVAFLSSCTDQFLDEQNPNQQTNATFWKTEADFKSGIYAVYSPMIHRNYGYYGEIKNFWTDIFQSPDYWDDPFTNTYTGGFFSVGDVRIAEYFKNCYAGINYANQVIENGEAATLDASVKNPYIAEAYFLRGLYYFFLVNDFGSVPLHTSVPKTREETNLERSPMEDVWQVVIADFTKAAEGLPATRPIAEAGRATKGAALAFLGRSYLYRGEWAKAQETLESIVDNAATYQYKLQENYGELFDGAHEMMVEKGGGEGIFAIGYAPFGGGVWGSDASNRDFTTWQELLWAPSKVGGWEAGIRVNPTMVVNMLQEPTADGGIDPRLEATVAWDHAPTEAYWKPLYDVYQAKGYQMDPNYTYFQKNFHDTWGNVGWTTTDGKFHPKMYQKKYLNWWNSWTYSNLYLDYYGMRYADVLLMLAEAYAQQGNVTDAAPLVRQIRDRAKLAVKDFTASKEVMMAEIRNQRHLEFSFEIRYFYDLRRWGLLEQTINETKRPDYQDYKPKYDYLPIPQAELDSNPNITQNDAWK